MDTENGNPTIWLQNFHGAKIVHRYLPHQESENPIPLLQLCVSIDGQIYNLAGNKAMFMKMKEVIEEHFSGKDADLSKYGL